MLPISKTIYSTPDLSLAPISLTVTQPRVVLGKLQAKNEGYLCFHLYDRMACGPECQGTKIRGVLKMPRWLENENPENRAKFAQQTRATVAGAEVESMEATGSSGTKGKPSPDSAGGSWAASQLEGALKHIPVSYP